MASGYLALHLHAHLPFIRHPEHPEFLEERWLFDAIIDTYVPLLRTFNQLAEEGVAFRLSMTLSPPLLEMLADSLLQERFAAHLERQLELCDRELERTAGYQQFHQVVRMYSDRLEQTRSLASGLGGNFATGFKRLADQGRLEILTCGATHGFLPHMQLLPGAVDRQLGFAVECHEQHLGRKPDGIWLPECAYFPGLEDHLLRHGLVYFFADSHALELGMPRSLRSAFSHVYLPNGVAAFARDTESSRQVWSRREGYPGDVNYRDYYRDIGFDLPRDYMAPYIHLGDTPVLTGFKYYRITGDTDHKLPYDRATALGIAEEHARHFVHARKLQVDWIANVLDRPPIIVAPYDAELFGHWWFEGPDFLFFLLREAAGCKELETIAARDYLLKYPTAQVVTPNPSTWGEGGYFRFWLNGSNEWIYPHLSACARQLSEAEISQGPSASIRQAGRELLLAQASDWAFIMSTGTSPDYAAKRTATHASNMLNLIRDGSGLDAGFIGELEQRNNIFSYT